MNVKKPDQRLARKKVELDKDVEVKLKGCREQASRNYASKFKKQEERFKRMANAYTTWST